MDEQAIAAFRARVARQLEINRETVRKRREEEMAQMHRALTARMDEYDTRIASLDTPDGLRDEACRLWMLDEYIAAALPPLPPKVRLVGAGGDFEARAEILDSLGRHYDTQYARGDDPRQAVERLVDKLRRSRAAHAAEIRKALAAWLEVAP